MNKSWLNKSFYFSLICSCSILLTALDVLGCTIGFLAGSGGLGDESFNDMTYAGIGKAANELDCKIVVREWEPAYSERELLQELIAEEASVLILNGDQFLPLIKDFASLHPEKFFIANDFQAEHSPNVKSIVYSQHQGAFLAGALAGSFSKSKHLGFIGAIDIDVIHAFELGFTEGVRYVTPHSQIQIEYISNLPNYSGFNNPKAGNQLALEMYKNGIDVVFGVAGMSGNGIIQAARLTDKFVIGVDSNQDHMAKGNVLTSVIKRLDIGVYKELKQALRGEFSPGTTWYGLENNGVSLTDMEYTHHLISPETKVLISELREKIISGEIEVTNYMMKMN